MSKVSSGWRRLLPVVMSLAIMCLVVALIVTNVRISSRPDLSSRAVTEIAKAQSRAAVSTVTSASPVAVSVYREARAGLVTIEATQIKGGDDLGSGFIVDSSGDVMTALHVVRDAKSITLIFADGTTAQATIKTADAGDDIAVLTADKLPAVVVPETLGGGGGVGDAAFAVGDPVGLVGSLTAGVISGLDRTFAPVNGRTLTGLIQFDASVNPGSSGGPLLNAKGQVIGVVEGLANPAGSDSFAGIGFAIPIGTAGGAAGEPAK